MRDIYIATTGVLIFLGEEPDSGVDGAVHDAPEVLIQHPYFSRVWVVQEIGSAREAHVIFGRQVMHWNSFTPIYATCHTRHGCGTSIMPDAWA